MFHVDDMMDFVVFKYISLSGLEIALKSVNGRCDLFGILTSVERLVGQHQANRQVLVLSTGHDPWNRGRLSTKPFRAGGGGRGRGRQLNRFLQSVLQHAELDGALATTVSTAKHRL